MYHKYIPVTFTTVMSSRCFIAFAKCTILQKTTIVWVILKWKANNMYFNYMYLKRNMMKYIPVFLNKVYNVIKQLHKLKG